MLYSEENARFSVHFAVAKRCKLLVVHSELEENILSSPLFVPLQKKGRILSEKSPYNWQHYL